MKLLLTCLFAFCLAATAQAASAKSYGISQDPAKVCPAVQNQLGQLLVAGVDGFGQGVEQAIHPDYVKLVKLLGLGGVLPKFGKQDASLIFESTGALFGAADKPLLIGIENTTVAFKDGLETKLVGVGFGPGAGWLRHYQKANASCFAQQSFLDGFLHKALGLNYSLGPSIEFNRYSARLMEQNVDIKTAAQKLLRDYRYFAVKTTLRQYPYTAFSASLKSLQKSQVLDKLAIFKQLAANAEFLLTGELYNKNIDADNRVAFSKPWIQLLKNKVDYQGLVVGDARRFNAASLPSYVKKWLARHPQDDPRAAYVAGMILSGHDMLLLQGVARETISLFEDLSVMACREDDDGKRLQARIQTAFAAIEKFKKSNRGALSYRPKADPYLLKEVLAYKHQLDNLESCPAEQVNDSRFARIKQQILEVY